MGRAWPTEGIDVQTKTSRESGAETHSSLALR